MRTQKVSVDVWKMFYGSCSYLLLAFVAYVFLKLVNGCIWLPSYLKKSNGNLIDTERQNAVELNENTNDDEDKKNV